MATPRELRTAQRTCHAPAAAAARRTRTVSRRAQGGARVALVETKAKARQLEEEVVITHGKIEDLARSMMKKLIPMMEAMAALEKLEVSQRTAKEAELAVKVQADLMGLMPLQRLVMKLEDRPADVARFFAIALEETLKLPAALRPRLERSLLADFEQLKNDGLIYSMRPDENTDSWIARRATASLEMETHG